MKYFIYSFLIISTINVALGQSRQDSLNTFLDKKYKISNDGMYVLGGWALASLATGAYGALSTEGSQKYFHQMNVLWGGVNLLIAYTAQRSLRNPRHEPAILMKAELDQKKTERLFLINAGLDVIYIGAGAGLKQWSLNQDSNKERIDGYGNSFIVQGAFLLGFDVVMYMMHRKNRKLKLTPLLEGLSINGSSIIYRFG